MEGILQYRRLRKDITQKVECGHDDPVATPEKRNSNDTENDTQAGSYVDFGVQDPHNPQAWPYNYKLFCAFIIWLLAFVTGWASAADSTGLAMASKQFHVSQTADSLTTAMYLFGVAVGGVLAGPISETVGRLPTYLSTFAIYLVWLMATALARNYTAQILFRLLAGFFASASMAIYGGSLADLFEREERASVWPFFALSPLLGPTVAPIASGWIAEYFGWRWVEWSTLIISSAIFVLAMLFLPETFGPTILSWKARLLREETGNDKYKTEHDEQGGPFALLRSRLLRVTSFILTESTTVLFELYLTLLYVLVYGFLEGFQYIFTDTYDFSTGERYSSFVAIAIGILAALPYILLIYHFTSVRSKRNSTTISPEGRLLPSLFTSPLLPISLFWIGFTNRLDISYWSNLSACFVLGFALMVLFTSTYHYLLDAYGTNSSSALGAVTFVRYAVSGGVVIATNPLYEALTVRWMLTLLGGIAVLLAPVPWAFWRYGSKIRKKSKWAES